MVVVVTVEEEAAVVMVVVADSETANLVLTSSHWGTDVVSDRVVFYI